MDLFSSSLYTQSFELPLRDAAVKYFPNFIESKKATSIFNQLYKETKWREDTITVFGKTYKQPRLTALYGEDNTPYSYSNIVMHPQQFTTTLLELKTLVEKKCSTKFNAVLLNLYRDGNDSNGWHSDDEKELGKDPFIASLSLGENRTFHLKHKQEKNLKYKLVLQNGSLLIMKGATQENFKHQIPKTKKNVQPRINLTFRKLEKTFV